jgi:putative endonuclease
MAGLVPAIPIPDTLTMKPGYVYILASRPGGAIYVGVTGNLSKRVAEHKSGLVAGHTKRYRIDKLVHFEAFDDIRDALQREKNVKHWSRAYKTRLILQSNPTWRDLYADIMG